MPHISKKFFGFFGGSNNNKRKKDKFRVRFFDNNLVILVFLRIKDATKIEIFQQIVKKVPSEFAIPPKNNKFNYKSIHYYIAFLYNSIKSSFVTSLGFPGLQGSSIALSAKLPKSSSFTP